MAVVQDLYPVDAWLAVKQVSEIPHHGRFGYTGACGSARKACCSCPRFGGPIQELVHKVAAGHLAVQRLENLIGVGVFLARGS